MHRLLSISLVIISVMPCSQSVINKHLCVEGLMQDLSYIVASVTGTCVSQECVFLSRSYVSLGIHASHYDFIDTV